MDEPKSILPRTAAVYDEGGGLGLPLFSPGEQLPQEFVENLIGHPVRPEPARLEGHRELVLDGEGWTVLVPAPGEQVTGRLYRRLVAEDYRRFDSYQGVTEGLYERTVATVHATRHEGSEPAWVYLPTERTLRRYSAGS
jgi:hypothetical protein